ncbi:hypothetical protein F5876DRAFT_61137 [Lentinula aff. lateritia]|uniref:Uncharacterized protein n=1 Tax=Lentinula aff. lateritia TaxID=2804960 RepID=A0ACC1UGF1_9AGAR|nr:hypothetical protein F5876DRAFT_61137 [Lentinula aff. lateritia]
MTAYQDVRAFIPNEQKPSNSSSSFYPTTPVNRRPSGEQWDHSKQPTIFFSPILDIMLRRCTSWQERCHILAQGLIVCCHELGHTLPRFVCSWKRFQMHIWTLPVDDRMGEGAEFVEEDITGGHNFLILNNIVQPHLAHGFRITGRPMKGFLVVVVNDDRVISFLRYFLEEREHSVVPIPLLPNSEWIDHFPFSLSLHGKKYHTPIQPTTTVAHITLFCINPKILRIPVVAIGAETFPNDISKETDRFARAARAAEAEAFKLARSIKDEAAKQ